MDFKDSTLFCLQESHLTCNHIQFVSERIENDIPNSIQKQASYTISQKIQKGSVHINKRSNPSRDMMANLYSPNIGAPNTIEVVSTPISCMGVRNVCLFFSISPHFYSVMLNFIPNNLN
jgi:hypothetical protein